MDSYNLIVNTGMLSNLGGCTGKLFLAANLEGSGDFTARRIYYEQSETGRLE